MRRSPLVLFILSLVAAPILSGAAAAPAGEASPSAVVESYFNSYRAMDVDGMLASFADDARFVDVAQRHDLRGLEGLRQLLVPLVSVHTAMGIEVQRQVASGNLVVVEYLYEGTLSGEALRAATGKETCRDTPYRLPVTSWFEVRDGRISRQTDFIDLATLEEVKARASGVVAQAPSGAANP